MQWLVNIYMKLIRRVFGGPSRYSLGMNHLWKIGEFPSGDAKRINRSFGQYRTSKGGGEFGLKG